ncbi:MAG: glycosyltransferase family 2 protein [Bacteroidia bacterium]|nr:glycosyltransferase family 2 protein [Bacteroidia bacterium]
MEISVIIPLYNEQDSIRELSEWIIRVMNANQYSYELILIDDGSNDNSWQVIENLVAGNSCIHGIKFRRNHGKSAALHCGFNQAEGEVVITMDADLQDVPDEIPAMYQMIHNQGYDLVSGWKKKRHDPLSKTLPSRFFNWTARKVTKIKLHDFNCGFKAYRKQVIKNIEVYGEMHRYIPVLAKWAGFTKIGEKSVIHQPRKYGTTKFGLDRFIKGFLDLMTIMFVSKFGKRPMHFFGTAGTLMFILGFLAALYLGVEKLYFVYNKIPYQRVTESPYFYISLVLMIIGTQFFLSGFLGEMISRNASDRNDYQIENKI